MTWLCDIRDLCAIHCETSVYDIRDLCHTGCVQYSVRVVGERVTLSGGEVTGPAIARDARDTLGMGNAKISLGYKYLFPIDIDIYEIWLVIAFLVKIKDIH